MEPLATPDSKEFIPTLTLNDLELNDEATVLQIQAGFRATQRLSGMGITPGVIIKKISQAPFHGPIQILVRGSRLALGQGLAHKIFLQRI